MPSSRAATVPLVGGRPCLDLVNSMSWRGRELGRQEDHLRTAADCLVWCVRAGVLTDAEAVRLRDADGQVLVASLHDLREVVGTDLAGVATPDASTHLRPSAPTVDGVCEPPPACAGLDRLGGAVRDAIAHSRLVPVDGAARWEVDGLDPRTPARRIALDLYDQLTHPRGRIGRCGDPACGWVFIDTSRAGNRRWCSSADCGNRHRVRRHHARRRALDGTTRVDPAR